MNPRCIEKDAMPEDNKIYNIEDNILSLSKDLVKLSIIGSN